MILAFSSGIFAPNLLAYLYSAGCGITIKFSIFLKYLTLFKPALLDSFAPYDGANKIIGAVIIMGNSLIKIHCSNLPLVSCYCLLPDRLQHHHHNYQYHWKAALLL